MRIARSRCALAMTGGFTWGAVRGRRRENSSPLELAKIRSRLPRKNPSTSLRLVPLPLGTGPILWGWWSGPRWASAPTGGCKRCNGRATARVAPTEALQGVQWTGGRKGLPYRFNFPCGGPGRQRRFGPAYIRFPRGIALLQRRKAPDPAHRPGRGWGRR